MEEKCWQRIVKYTELQGTSGQEEAVAQAFQSDLTPLVDEVWANPDAGVFGIKKGQPSGPKIMFAAHLDEVGFMVAAILPTGALQVVPLGGWNPMTVSAQRFTLFTKKGQQYPLVSAGLAPHLMRGRAQADVKAADILFDAGFESAAQAADFGVAVGDFIVPSTPTTRLANPNRVVSKAWDNRFGVVTILTALEALQGVRTPNTLLMGANVQEEVGLRGAKASLQALQPDLFFAIDSSAANDLDQQAGRQGQLDQGTLLRVFDPTVVTRPKLQALIQQTAEENDIPYQSFVSPGGTDAGASAQVGMGIPAVALGVASRSIHSHETVWSVPDFEAAVALVVALAKKIDQKTYDELVGRSC
ncbi:M20/M25/M40 family metallo-hydrolase [Leuconostocaceae bacterium ESL0958]|nr:M20/M25/M40 family metallo-hydrolase [Leuconostocaceae bacterium ESL0958]